MIADVAFLDVDKRRKITPVDLMGTAERVTSDVIVLRQIKSFNY